MASTWILPSLVRVPLLAGALTLGLGAIAACGSAGGGGTGEATSQVASDLFANDQTAYDYFLGKGLTNFQAAGIVGNLDQESGVDPNAVQSGGPGRGIAQWSVGGRWDTDSGDNCVAYASQQGQSVYSLTLQLDFIWYELTTFSGYGLAALKASTNVTDATIAFETDFEGCGTCDQSTRISYAQGVLNAYGAAEYAATFVSQSFPYASTTMMMKQGDVVPSYIELKNTGTKSWDSNTRIGTTQPRDRKSSFADGTWVADNRPSAVKGTVAPGQTYKFTFDLAANDVGTFDEFFGVVEDGVAWFSDSGQGGPPDNQLEVKIQVVANPNADAGSTHSDGGTSHADGGTHTDGGAHTDAGMTEGDGATSPVDDDGGSTPPPSGSDDSGTGTEPGDAAGNDALSGQNGGGCSVGTTRSASSSWSFVLGLALAAGGLRLRRRRG